MMIPNNKKSMNKCLDRCTLHIIIMFHEIARTFVVAIDFHFFFCFALRMHLDNSANTKQQQKYLRRARHHLF